MESLHDSPNVEDDSPQASVLQSQLQSHEPLTLQTEERLITCTSSNTQVDQLLAQTQPTSESTPQVIEVCQAISV